MLGGVDISDHVAAVDIQRIPNHIDQVDVTLYVEKFGEENGFLVVHCIGPEGLNIRPKKRLVL